MRQKKTGLVSIWNPKGGQGKSMLAINLAAAAVATNLKPLVICQDPQGTSTNYYKRRGDDLGFQVIGEVPQERPDADIIFLDHQASDWELPPAKHLLMPLKPSRDQYDTYKVARHKAQMAGKEVITVVTDVHHNRFVESTNAQKLRELGAFVIPSNTVYSRASDTYTTIFDSTHDGAYKVSDRREELINILDYIVFGGSRYE